MDRRFLEEFTNPPALYRGKPFWSWNGRLERAELLRQIRIFHEMGFGGFFMHARVGLETEYLGPAWFEAVRACIGEAERLGMEAWLYDEDRWPSGAAGGLVTVDPRWRMQHLDAVVHDSVRSFRWSKAVLAAFVARLGGAEGHVARDVRRLKRGERPRLAKGESLVAFQPGVMAESAYFNNQTYLDTMNPDAVRRFIEVTHEAYRREIGEHFGRTVPGIFTDECYPGGMHMKEGRRRLIWTERLPRVFRERYGYDLLPRLMSLVWDVEDEPVTPARRDFRDCTTHLFVEAFARPIGEWCAANNLLFTGHILDEGRLRLQAASVGSAMRFYEHMQAPGMDILTEHWREYDTAKQVSSAARQFGRRWRLSELYGCTGWDFPFLGHKAVGDWEAALGINLRVPHLSWYTMEGEAKRDYPASIHYQSPWWRLYSVVEDYFARLHVVLSRGEEVRDVLVVHPVESMWTLCRYGWRDLPDADRMDRSIAKVRDALLAAHLDFDYGDEEILARHATVSRAGGAKGAGPRLRVKRAAYRAVVVPPMTTIRRSTLRLLERFRAAGGLVLVAGSPASHVDAEPTDAAAVFASGGPRAEPTADALGAALGEVRRISVTDGTGGELAPVLYQLREDGEAWYCALVNTGHDYRRCTWSVRRHGLHRYEEPAARNRTLAFGEVILTGFEGARGAPLEADPETGELVRAEARRAGEAWRIRTSLPELGSRLFVVPKRKAGAPSRPARRALETVGTKPIRRKRIPVRLDEPNVVVLDRAAWRLGTGSWRREADILLVDRAIRDAMGLAWRKSEMVQPWARKGAADGPREAVALRYRFEVRTPPAGPVRLALERPGTWRVTLNGLPVPTTLDEGWWVDRSLRTVTLPSGALRKGANELRMEGDLDAAHPGLEAIFLLGDFGVRLSGTTPVLTGTPRELTPGSWTGQGLPFYAGSVAYTYTVRPTLAPKERLFLAVPEFRGVAVRVWAGGVPAGVRGWAPWEVEITEPARRAVAEGRALELAVEIVGHRRNALGPLHHRDPELARIGPPSYYPGGAERREAPVFVPVGLMGAPRLVRRRPV